MSHWGRWPIRRKITLLVAVFNVAIILTVVTVLGTHTYRTLLENRIETSRQSVVLVREKLEMLGERLESFASAVVTSDRVQRNLRARRTESGPPSYSMTQQMRAPLNNLVYTRSLLDGIIVYDLHGYSYSSGSISSVSLLPKSIRGQLGPARGISVWRPTHMSGYTRDGRRYPVLSMARVVYDANTGRELGFLELTVTEMAIESLYRDVWLGAGADLMIVTSDGEILSAIDKDLLLAEIESKAIPSLHDWERVSKQSTNLSPLQAGHVVLTEPIAGLDWHVVAIIPSTVVVEEAVPTIYIFLLFGLLAVAAALMSAREIGSWFSRPILSLAETMQNVSEGDLEVRAPVKSGDELGQLADTFNAMLDRMSHLLEQIRKGHETERELEFNVLQARINPHFLYNSLDTIVGLADTDAGQLIPEFVNRLSSFYRRVLGQQRSYVSLEDELALCEDFLSILSIRFEQSFVWSIDSDPELRGVEVPRMIIQPLVENAVFHGLRPAHYRGQCNVSVRRSKRSAEVLVIDDGVGIDDTQISRVHDDEPGDSFGLPSIRKRLEFTFGVSDALHISQLESGGTQVLVRIPLEDNGYEPE